MTTSLRLLTEKIPPLRESRIPKVLGPGPATGVALLVSLAVSDVCRQSSSPGGAVRTTVIGWPPPGQTKAAGNRQWLYFDAPLQDRLRAHRLSSRATRTWSAGSKIIIATSSEEQHGWQSLDFSSNRVPSARFTATAEPRFRRKLNPREREFKGFSE
jgi:hypothetical protein